MVTYLMDRRLKGIFWSHENVPYLDYHVGYTDVYICQKLLNFIFKINMLLYVKYKYVKQKKIN